MNEKYFTERLFWLPDTNTLLHVSFMHGHGWFAEIENRYNGEWFFVYENMTYAALMLHFAHRSPELLLQEEW